MKIFDPKYLSALLSFAVAGTLQAQLVNGNFETGNLSQWTIFTTSNGNLGSYYGLPNVASFDVAGTGTSSDAAQFQVGLPTGTPGNQEGGGISQTFTASLGPYVVYSVHADIAATSFADPSRINLAAGLFTLLMDGVTLDTVDLGAISGGQTLRSTLEALVPLSSGSHQISIEITRPYLNGGGFGNTPLEYVDNVGVTPIPEPSDILPGLFGLWCALAMWKSKVQ